MKFNQAVALITGGAQGLGRMFTHKLLERGTKVVVADMNLEAGARIEEEALKRHGEGKLKFFKCDVTNSRELSDKFEEFVQKGCGAIKYILSKRLPWIPTYHVADTSLAALCKFPDYNCVATLKP